MRQVPAFVCLLLLMAGCGPRHAPGSSPPGTAIPEPGFDPVRVLLGARSGACGGLPGPWQAGEIAEPPETGILPTIAVEPESDPLWPTAEEGEFDVAVLYGAEADRLRLRGSSHRWTRIPEWDREYGLWMDPDSRWTADPALREWIGASVDRSRLVRVVFAGAAEPSGGAETAAGPRPLGAATRPRIDLHHPAEDARARALAAALKADLDARGFTIEIRPDDRPRGGSGLRLVLLQKVASDPLANARFWVGCFGDGASDAAAVLESASRAADAASRAALASQAMAVLENDARWVPLLRVRAWLAVRHGIGSVRADEPGRIVVAADAGTVP